MIYFYKIVSNDYESYNERTFVSEYNYSQSEFENIVVEVYRASCEYYMSKKETNVCFDLSFTPNERIFDFTEGFTVKYLRDKYGLMIPKIKNSIFIDSTYHGAKDDINKRLCKELDSLPIDESCWDNDCSRLNGDKERSTWYRSNCLVYRRKQARIKERNCDNCRVGMKYESCKKKANPCDSWSWDGNGTLKCDDI